MGECAFGTRRGVYGVIAGCDAWRSIKDKTHRRCWPKRTTDSCGEGSIECGEVDRAGEWHFGFVERRDTSDEQTSYQLGGQVHNFWCDAGAGCEEVAGLGWPGYDAEAGEVDGRPDSGLKLDIKLTYA